MAQKDTIAFALDEGTLKSVRDAVGVLTTKLLPLLKILSAQDRKELAKMGDKSVAFVQKAFEYAQLHPNLCPGWLDVEAFRIDLEALKLLQSLSRALAAVVEGLDDTEALSGSEAYLAALVFYSNVKNGAKLQVPGAQIVADDLSARFPGTVNAAKAKSATA